MTRAATVSVVMPVFEAEAHVAAAVESALGQPETAEVMIVDDGSDGASRAVCDALAASAAGRVRVLSHEGGRNRGPAASRNLALREATQPLVAFLDADDVYLPGRFEVSVPRLLADPNVDGVYEAVGLLFEDAETRERWAREDGRALITLPEGLAPERLLVVLLSGTVGNIAGGGLLVRRSALLAVGGFDETLRTHEDTGLFWKLASRCRLVGGRLERPVALYRRHGRGLAWSRLAERDGAVRQAAACWRWSVRSGGAPGEQRAFRAALAERARAAPAGCRGLAALAGRLGRLWRAVREAPGVLLEPRLWRRRA